MDIGRIERIIDIRPVTLPVPEELPNPASAPVIAPIPAGPRLFREPARA